MRLATFVRHALRPVVPTAKISVAGGNIHITVDTDHGVPLDAFVQIKEALGADRLVLRGETWILVGGHGSDRLEGGSSTAIVATVIFTPERLAEIANLQ